MIELNVIELNVIEYSTALLVENTVVPPARGTTILHNVCACRPFQLCNGTFKCFFNSACDVQTHRMLERLQPVIQNLSAVCLVNLLLGYVRASARY